MENIFKEQILEFLGYPKDYTWDKPEIKSINLNKEMKNRKPLIISPEEQKLWQKVMENREIFKKLIAD